jgi:anti-sigma factor RsiW
MQELSDFLDESVDTATRQELERHISECPNCWVVADTTRRTVRIYKGMDPYPVPADVESRLMAALERKMASKRG